jgi:hypothetical protein
MPYLRAGHRARLTVHQFESLILLHLPGEERGNRHLAGGVRAHGRSYRTCPQGR